MSAAGPSPPPGQRFWGLALAAVTGLGCLWRLHNALTVGRFADEEICIGIAARVLDPGAPWPLHGGDHPALAIYLLAASAWAFGPTLFGYRLLSVLAGSLTVAVLALAVARSSARREALLAAVLLAANPFHAGLSALAIELPFQLLFVTVALWLLSGTPLARRGLVAAAIALGLAFLCSESTLLVGLAWALVLWRRSESTSLTRRDYALAAGAGLIVVAPDLFYNFTARGPDLVYAHYRYVNYLDHLARIAHPSFSLQGLGFFLRDAFNAGLGHFPPVWQEDRCEYAGPGITLGIVLLLGWLSSFGKGGDPAGGFWSLAPLLFVLVASFTGPGPSPTLDPPTWTWPAPALPLVTAGAARLLDSHWRRAWPLLVAVLVALLLRSPASLIPCE